MLIYTGLTPSTVVLRFSYSLLAAPYLPRPPTHFLPLKHVFSCFSLPSTALPVALDTFTIALLLWTVWFFFFCRHILDVGIVTTRFRRVDVV